MSEILKFLSRLLVNIVDGALHQLDLPQPYPRLRKIFSVVSMLNYYVASIIFLLIFIVVFMVMCSPAEPSLLKQTGAMAFAIFLLYFVAFNFVQAERERIILFNGNEN